MTAIRVSLLLLLLAPLARAQGGVLRVDATGAGGAFTTIQDAVDAALDGDAILVATGTYPGFTIDDKSVIVAADAGAAVVVSGATVVQNVGPARTASLLGLELKGGACDGTPVLLVTTCTGPVFLQDLTVHNGLDGFFYSTADAIRTEACASVSLVRTQTVEVTGAADLCCVGYAACLGGFGPCAPRGGLVSTDSTLFVYDCDLVGSEGCDAGCFSTPGQDGFPGLSLSGGSALVVDSRVEGGPGGPGVGPCNPSSQTGFVHGGEAGPAVRLQAGLAPSVARFLASSLAPGAGGVTVDVQAGTTQMLSGAPRSVSTTSVLPDKSTATMEIRGEPFDFYWLGLSFDPEASLVYYPSLLGTVSPLVPWLEFRFIGALDGNGEATLTFFIDDWGFPHVPIYHQTYHWDGVDFFASNPELSLILDDV